MSNVRKPNQRSFADFGTGQDEKAEPASDVVRVYLNPFPYHVGRKLKKLGV